MSQNILKHKRRSSYTFYCKQLLQQLKTCMIKSASGTASN